MERIEDDHFLVGRRVNDDGVSNHWQSVDLSEHKITRPTVLVLGGNITNDNRTANGYAKVVESMLGGFAGDADILSVNYNGCGNYFSPILEKSIIRLANELFVPLISSGGQRLKLDEACKNVRKLTIFAHCFGYNNVAIGLQEVLFNLLGKYGYDMHEAGKIVEQLFVVSFGTEIQKDWFKSVNVVSPFDSSFFETSTQIWGELLESDIGSCKFITEKDKAELKKIASLSYWKREEAIKKFCNKNQRCFVVRQGNRLSLATSMLKTDVDADFSTYEVEPSAAEDVQKTNGQNVDIEFSKNEHQIKELARNKNWDSFGGLTASGEHTSKCLAVENERKKELVPVDMDELETTLNGIVYAFNTQETVPFDREM